MDKPDYSTPWEKEQDSMEGQYRGNKNFDVKHRMISDMTKQIVEGVMCSLGRNIDNYNGTMCDIETDDFVGAEHAKKEFLITIRYEARRLIKILLAESVLRVPDKDIELLINALKALDTVSIYF